MWIQDKYGTAINSRHIITIRCDSEVKPFRVDAWLCDYEGDADNCYYLDEFETREEAKEYIKNLAMMLNFADNPIAIEKTTSGWESYMDMLFRNLITNVNTVPPCPTS